MEIKKKLDKEIDRQLEEISGMPVGSAEMAKAVETLSELHNLRMEEKKESDANEVEREKIAVELKKAKDAKIASFVGAGMTLGMFAVRLVNDNMWMTKGFKFEETGTLCSKVFAEVWKGVFRRK